MDSGPNDHIFVYYSDHGGPGVLGQYSKHSGTSFRLVIYVNQINICTYMHIEPKKCTVVYSVKKLQGCLPTRTSTVMTS